MRDLQVITDATHLCVGDTIEEVYGGGKRFRVTPKPRAQRKVWRIKQLLANGSSVLGSGTYSSYEEAVQAITYLRPHTGPYWAYSIEEVDG